MSLRVLTWALVAAVGGLLATARASASPESIEIEDLTPKFLTFYRAALAENATPEQRFQLWQQDYGFAAVPPTPEGAQIARRLLDEAWPKYPSVMTRIEQGAKGMEPSPDSILKRVIAELRPDKPVRVKIIVYVGGLEGNAFTAAGKSGIPTVALPVEQSPYDRGPVMAHEFTHAVQISMGTNSGGWIRSVGETVLAEGLAMRVAQKLYPDRSAASFVEIPDKPGWLSKCEARHDTILRDVRAVLASDKSEDVMRFTMGMGPAGVDREAYYAAWVVTEYWLAHGIALDSIARIPEAEAPLRVRSAIDAIIGTR